VTTAPGLFARAAKLMRRLAVASARSLPVICVSALFVLPVSANAQNQPPTQKNLRETLGAQKPGTYDFTLDSAFDILNDTTNTDLYDPITISTLRRLKEDAQPAWNPEDIDPDLTRRVVERAFAIQSGRNLSNLINRSELQTTYKSIKQGLKSVQDTFRYSVQNTGNGVEVSKQKQGRKILELNMEFNLKQGLDPQIKIGESVRFRYDYTSKRPVLEYGFRF
jgi:hypothetical protein